MTYPSADTSKPIILYYTGDGGFNSFSTEFAKHFNEKDAFMNSTKPFQGKVGRKSLAV